MDHYAQQQIDWLKARLDRIEGHLGLDAKPAAGAGGSAPPSAFVAELARTGRTLDAVRQYRSETGADLETARTVVGAVTP